MGKQMWRYAAFEKNTQAIQEFCSKYGFSYRVLNRGYQIRIEEVVDVYPVRMKWHWLSTGDRGEAHSMEHLRKLMLHKLEEELKRKHFDISKGEQPIAGVEIEGVNMVTVHEVDGKQEMSYPKTDGYMVLGKQPNEMNVLTVKVPKPKWWQFRKRWAMWQLERQKFNQAELLKEDDADIWNGKDIDIH